MNLYQMSGGKRGLSNLGNTCYMNSILQCLGHLKVFHPLEKEFSNECQRYAGRESFRLMSEWNDLVNELWSEGSNAVVPQRFLDGFIREIKQSNKSFNGFHQNDIDEFLIFLMEFLHNSIKKKGGYYSYQVN